MELILIKSYKHLEIYEKDWTDILKDIQNTNPFIEYEFIYNWWLSIGANQTVEIYAVKENNRIIAFFPFQIKKTWLGYMIQFLAVGEAHYMNFVAKKVDMSRVIMFVMDKLIKEKKSVVFHFQGLLESSGTPIHLSEYLKARGISEKYSRKEKSINSMEESYYKLEWNTDFNYTRTTIFSTHTLQAKAHRNFLWAKEMFISKKNMENSIS